MLVQMYVCNASTYLFIYISSLYDHNKYTSQLMFMLCIVNTFLLLITRAHTANVFTSFGARIFDIHYMHVMCVCAVCASNLFTRLYISMHCLQMLTCEAIIQLCLQYD